MSVFTRIIHAPYNIAGQGGYIAKGQRSFGHKSDVLVFEQPAFKYEFTYNIRLKARPKVLRWLYRFYYFVICLLRYDYFHYHFCETILPFYLDLPILKIFRKKIIFHFWGSEIRDCRISGKYTEFNFKECEEVNNNGYLKFLEKKKFFKKYVHLFIVGDYSLLPYAPFSVAIKQSIDLEKFKYVGARKNRTKLKFVHAPSSRDAKGTKYILQAIERLKSENYDFDFILLENMTNKEVKFQCSNSDIIIDQLMFESYGTFSLENMAIGKPVLCRLDPAFDHYYDNIPIINANPRNIYSVLKNFFDDPIDLETIGINSRKFVEKVHNPEKITKKIIKLYSKI